MHLSRFNETKRSLLTTKVFFCGYVAMSINLCDFEGGTKITNEDSLLSRLTTVRFGQFGAFVLNHANTYPALFVHLNLAIAYLHFFPADGHAGYQPTEMTPHVCPETVHFLQTSRTEADSFDMPDSTLVDADTAYQAAIEFFRFPKLPSSITWAEL